MSNQEKEREVEYIQIVKSDSSQHVPLSKVRKILRAYQEDIYDYNYKLSSKRLGKILTVIDGAIADQTQRKAIKDIVNDVWYGEQHIDGHITYPQLSQAVEAIGFELYDKNAPNVPEPVQEHNKYSNL